MTQSIIKLNVVAMVSLAMAGCGQPSNTNTEAGTAQSENADGTTGGDAGQTTSTMGVGSGEQLNDMAPVLDPNVQPQTDAMGDQSMQNDGTLEQPADTVRDAPQ